MSESKDSFGTKLTVKLQVTVIDLRVNNAGDI